MALNDSEIRPFQTDVTGLRSEWAKISKIYDSRGVTAHDSKRVSDDLRHYVRAIARTMDSDVINTIYQNIDSDHLVEYYGKPSAWSKTSAIDNGTGPNQADWSKLRTFIDNIPISYDDGAGNTYRGAPHVLLAADSDSSSKFISFKTLLKAYFINFLRYDQVELRRLQGELNIVKNDSDGYKTIAKNLPAHYDSDLPAATDFIEVFLDYFEENAVGLRASASNTERLLLPFNRDISYGSLRHDSDTNNLIDSDTSRNRLYYLRRKLASIVVEGIMLDSDFTDAGHTRTYGANLLGTRLGATYQTITRRSQPLHQGHFNLFYEYLDFAHIKRDSEFKGFAGVAGTIDSLQGKGVLTDSDSEGYSLGYDKSTQPGVLLQTRKDSDHISDVIARNVNFWGFMGLRLGAVDSDTMMELKDSDYRSRATSGGKRTHTNYYMYHPSFARKFKAINKRFVERTVVRYLGGNGVNIGDSDEKNHRQKVNKPLREFVYGTGDSELAYLQGNDSELGIIRTALINSVTDSDRLKIANDIVMRVIDSDSDDGLLIKNRLSDIVINQLINQDSENSLLQSVARKEILKLDSDSELVSRTFTSLLNRISESSVPADSDSMARDSDLRVRFDNLILDRVQRLDSDDLVTGTNLKATLKKNYIQTFDSDSDLQKRTARGVVQAIRDDSDIDQIFSKHIAESFRMITQEHIVNDSEGSYSSFTFVVPSTVTPPIADNVKVFHNGVRQLNSKSFNRLGTALVNHTVDISSSAVSGSNITINFAVNTAIDDVITIEYHTMVN
tara:strand:- start:115 stop:2466 length:2352 start_codon:yes stop_codon:yes gene_type:complete